MIVLNHKSTGSSLISISSYYNNTKIDDIDNKLSTLILNTYNKHDKYTCFTDYYNIEYMYTQFDSKANSLNTYDLHQKRGR